MANEIVTLASTLPSVTAAKALTVIQLVAAGKTVTEACADTFITVASLRAAIKREPMLQPMLDEALQVRNDILNDELINIEKRVSNPQMASVVSKNIQWVLERNDPGRFGARVSTEGGNEASKLLALALNEAIKRIPAPLEMRPSFTDVTFTEAGKETPPANLGGPAASVWKGDTPSPAVTQKPATLDELKALGLI